MFFQTKSGAYFNTNHIAALIPLHESKDDIRVEIVTSGGSTHVESVTCRKLEELLRGPQVVPASPGYELLSWSDCARCYEDAERSPIIGWRINDMGYAEPVATDLHNSDNTGILTPAGKLVVSGDGTFDGIEEWAEKNRRIKEEIAYRLAANDNAPQRRTAA